MVDSCILKFKEEAAREEVPPSVAAKYLRAYSLMGLPNAEALLPVLAHVGHVAGRMDADDVVVLMEVGGEVRGAVLIVYTCDCSWARVLHLCVGLAKPCV